MKRFFLVTMYLWLAVVVGLIAGLIFGAEAGVLTGMAVILLIAVFVLLRQAWWFVSGTGDYAGRYGFLKKIWDRIFNRCG